MKYRYNKLSDLLYRQQPNGGIYMKSLESEYWTCSFFNGCKHLFKFGKTFGKLLSESEAKKLYPQFFS